MARFFGNSRSAFVISKSPVEGSVDNSTPAVQEKEPAKKSDDMDAKAQEPVRKTEAGRYDDLEYDP